MSYASPPIAGVSALSEEEVRVLGCLLEKQRTTPDTYPLSLNSLRLACNQSTNRDPVVDYDEARIREALARLVRRGYVRLASGAGSRTAKYRHLLADALPMDHAEQALLCVLMLRGAQTPGELKQRSERVHAFGELAQVHKTLERLIGRGLVERLERRPGHKEERYVQLLGGAGAPSHGGGPEPGAPTPASTYPYQPGSAPAAGDHDVDGSYGARESREEQDGALAQLTARVERLERELVELRDEMRHSVERQRP